MRQYKVVVVEQGQGIGIQHAMVVIPGIVLTTTGVKTENVLWKKALHIVMLARKIVKKAY